MAELIWKNCKLYLSGYDISGDMNRMGLRYNAEILDVTKYGSNSRQRRAGLKDVEIDGGGFWNASSGMPDAQGTTYQKPDPVIFHEIGTTNGGISILPNGTQLGSLAYLVPGITAEYNPAGSVGDMLEFDFSAFGQEKVGRGQLLMQGLITTDKASASPRNASTARNLGVATTDKKIVTACHVLATSGASGASIDLEIAASTAADFSGSPTTLYVISITTGDIGEAIFNSTLMPSTSHSYIRAKTSQGGTSDKKFKVILTVGYQTGG